MKVDSFACDICHKQKQDANRWWKASTFVGGVVVMRWETEPMILARNGMELPASEDAHLCGEACLHEWLSKNLPAS